MSPEQWEELNSLEQAANYKGYTVCPMADGFDLYGDFDTIDRNTPVLESATQEEIKQYIATHSAE